MSPFWVKRPQMSHGVTSHSGLHFRALPEVASFLSRTRLARLRRHYLAVTLCLTRLQHSRLNGWFHLQFSNGSLLLNHKQVLSSSQGSKFEIKKVFFSLHPLNSNTVCLKQCFMVLKSETKHVFLRINMQKSHMNTKLHSYSIKINKPSTYFSICLSNLFATF